MDKRELTIDELNEVAGGMMAHLGPFSGPLIPPSTGPTIPVEPTPIIIYV
ncbi:MAG TPA: hypothetical protein VFC46_11315 [Humisphaera sp.]|nr:hypothetical protein [Humisphaera sp.]